MMQSGLSEVRRVRRWRSISEKRQIVQLTLEAGASVAEVAREHGLNANQVFKWRRAFERGELTDGPAALLPVTLSTSVEPENKVAKLPAHEGTDPASHPPTRRIGMNFVESRFANSWAARMAVS